MKSHIKNRKVIIVSNDVVVIHTLIKISIAKKIPLNKELTKTGDKKVDFCLNLVGFEMS